MKNNCCPNCVRTDQERRLFCGNSHCVCHKTQEHIVTNNKNFDAIKDNYCPRCYFEDSQLILRENCPHNKPQEAGWEERFLKVWKNGLAKSDELLGFIRNLLSNQKQEYEEELAASKILSLYDSKRRKKN